MNEHNTDVTWNMFDRGRKGRDVLRDNHASVSDGRSENGGIVLALQVAVLNGRRFHTCVDKIVGKPMRIVLVEQKSHRRRSHASA